jgi:Family of unknown function (DUF6232)
MPFCPNCGISVQTENTFCNGCGKPLGTASQSVSATTAVAAAPALEKTFHESSGVLVTNSRFIVGSQTFAMSGVTSVSSFVESPSHKGPLVAIVLGAMITLGGLVQGSQGLGGMLIGGVVLALGIWWFTQRKPTFHVLLRTSSTEVKALNSKDENYILAVVKALNDAIVYRR